MKKVENLRFIEFEPISIDIAIASALLDFNHSDPADRIIIATALDLNIPLITKDDKISSFKKIKCFWK